MSDDGEGQALQADAEAFRDRMRAHVLAAFGYAEEDMRRLDEAFAPLEEARRRHRAREQAFRDALPGLARDFCESFSEGLPGGLRVEWIMDEEP